jgi:hypothetical protein
MAMKKASSKMGKGGSLSAPDPAVSAGQAKQGVRPIKDIKGKNIEKKGPSAPKPAASAGQMKVAKRPIKNIKGKVIG